MDTMRPYKQVRITGALLGDRAIGADGVVKLAALPSRDVLLSQLAGAFAAPLATTAGLFDAPLRDVVGLVAALADQKRPRPDVTDSQPPKPRHPGDTSRWQPLPPTSSSRRSRR